MNPLNNMPGVTPEISAMLEHALRRRFAAKSVIVHEGEKSDALYFVVSGSVTVWVQDTEGEELILAYIGPGEFFGELSLFGAGITRSASVRARSQCELAVVTYERFQNLIQGSPGLLLPLAGQLAQRLHAANRKLGNLAFVDVAGRVARALLDLAADSQAITHPDGTLVRITREELGRLVNCSRQTASEVLSGLERQGLVEVQGKSIVVRGVFRSERDSAGRWLPIAVREQPVPHPQSIRQQQSVRQTTERKNDVR
jgi:CRP/FNR family cyclic AMP-dependent transcriptional regulator